MDTDISDILDISTNIPQSSTKLKDKLEDSLQLTNFVQNTETSSNTSIDKTRSLLISNLAQDSNPLLDKSKIGSKRRHNFKASVEVEEVVSNAIKIYCF